MDDLYEGFGDDDGGGGGLSAPHSLAPLRGAPAGSRAPGLGPAPNLGGGQRGMTGAVRGGGGPGGDGAARPMTSMTGSGYRGATTSGSRAASGGVGGPAAAARMSAMLPFAPERNPSPEAAAAELEARVHALLEGSTVAAAKGDLLLALERSKEAGRRERALVKMKTAAGMEPSADLTFAVCFNLAHMVRGLASRARASERRGA